MGIHLPLLLVGAAVLVTSTGLLCAVCCLIYRLKKASAIGEQPVATVFAARALPTARRASDQAVENTGDVERCGC